MNKIYLTLSIIAFTSIGICNDFWSTPINGNGITFKDAYSGRILHLRACPRDFQLADVAEVRVSWFLRCLPQLPIELKTQGILRTTLDKDKKADKPTYPTFVSYNSAGVLVHREIQVQVDSPCSMPQGFSVVGLCPYGPPRGTPNSAGRTSVNDISNALFKSRAEASERQKSNF